MARQAVRPERSRGGNPLRTLFGAILILALLMLVGLVSTGLLVQSRLDQDALRTRIEAIVLRQTGRALHLGALHLQLLPVPTLQAHDVALADWPDGARTEMLTADELQAHLALLPLLRHVVRLEGVTLTRPDLLLERRGTGEANWQLHKPASTGSGSGSASAHARWTIQVGSLRLLDGHVAWHDTQRGWNGAVAGVRLEGSGLAGSSPAITLSGHHGSAGFDVEFHGGALQRLVDQPLSGSVWPLRIDAAEQTNGHEVARLHVEGTLADPARGRGYQLALRAEAARLEALDALFPHAQLPAVAGFSLRTQVTDAAPLDAPRGDPQLGALDLHTGPFQAGAVLPGYLAGLSVQALSLQASDRDAPLRLALDGQWQGEPLALHGSAGTLGGWQRGRSSAGGQWGPVPIEVDLTAVRVHAHVSGNASSDTSDLQVTASAPVLQPPSGQGPTLNDVVLSGRLQTRHGLSDVSVSGLALASRQLGMTGSGTLSQGDRAVLEATLDVAHADLDALRTGWRSPGRAPETAPTAGSPTPVAANSPATPEPGRVLPFAALRRIDLSLRLSAHAVEFDGGTYRDLAAAATLKDGRLDITPFGVTGPDGPIAARLQLDATGDRLALSLQPSMLRASLLASLLGEPPVLNGTVELVGDVQGAGATAEALTSSLSGRLGASMANGSIANTTLARLAGRPIGLDPAGRTRLRCLGLPAELGGGQARIAPLALQTDRIEVQGQGTVALADGRLDLHLVPRISIGIAGASLPVHVGGTLAAPQASLDPAAPGGRFLLTIGTDGPVPDLCGPALRAARFGMAGPQPATGVSARPRKVPKPIDILRGLGLFR